MGIGWPRKVNVMEMSLPTVKVVTSVFNGEKYIQEQVDSVLSQTYPNIELYIRDNCSTDCTLEVLKKYTDCAQVHIIEGDKNLGCAGGSFELLRLCGNADYYAYFDCDDVWPENKVELAVEMLRGTDNQTPILYCSVHDVCDENLNFIEESPKVKNSSFQSSLVDGYAWSSTFVFNAKAKEMLTQNMPKHALSHDNWTLMVCSGLGKVIYDPRSLMKYRRHGNNITPSAQDKIKLVVWRIKHFFIDGHIKDIQAMIQEYSDMYADQLCEENKKILEMLTKRNINTALKKIFFPKMFRQNIPDEIMLRGLFLFGIL